MTDLLAMAFGALAQTRPLTAEEQQVLTAAEAAARTRLAQDELLAIGYSHDERGLCLQLRSGAVLPVLLEQAVRPYARPDHVVPITGTMSRREDRTDDAHAVPVTGG